jgi:glycosyltransferase involved in cell wall biosynthesis
MIAIDRTKEAQINMSSPSENEQKSDYDHTVEPVRRRITLITFPVDYGSVSLQDNLLKMLRQHSDVVHFIFSPDEMPSKGLKLSKYRRILLRLQQMPRLREACITAKRDGRIVVFQQISPALFAFPFLSGVRSYVFLDWTRKLYEPIVKRKISSRMTTALHGAILRGVSGVVAFTEASKRSLMQDYKVSANSIYRVPMPFDVFGSPLSNQNLSGPVKVLFVGGDFYRKGGDVLVRWFEGFKGCPVELTIVTQTDVRVPPGIRLIRNDPSFSAKEEFPKHDLFVLPTKYDAFPLAIGEAASAGLGVITLVNALGAAEVIDEGLNGYIAGSEADLIRTLSEVVQDRAQVERFKIHSRKKMIDRFTYEKVSSCLEAVFAG